MSSGRNIVNKLVDALTPDNQIEYLKFTRIKGSAFQQVLSGEKSKLGKNDVMTVKLKVNPQTIRYKQPKIITKVQTSSPGRFTVFDWGNELLQISIDGCTGNLLPNEITNGFNAFKSLANDLSFIDSDASAAVGSALQKNFTGEWGAIAQNIMIGSMTYYELLDLSPKYRTFQKLRELYTISDADQDIITLETGETIHRGYFVDFSFDQTSESPWNWKYSITFTSLNDLTSFFSRSDSEFNNNLLL